jgi:cytochrome c biogenesis protein CcdA/thioredoxin-related protein
MRKFKAAILFFLGIICWQLSPAQDSLFQGVKQWSISAQKLDEGKFELTINGIPNDSWSLFAPGQIILEMKTVTLSFADPSIRQLDDMTTTSATTNLTNDIFPTPAKLHESSFSWKTTILITGTVPATLNLRVDYNYWRAPDEFHPWFKDFEVQLEGGIKADITIKESSININKPINNCGDDGTKNKSILTIFLLGILGGFIALLTPCVFPMIPVTVTFFTKKSQNKKKGVGNAVLYGFFIFLIYVLITIPFHIASKTISPEIFNKISTNVPLNLVFFAVFVVFALSFFGLFEIGLPSGLANRADSKSGLGNIFGIFFMAATLAIVSFSCTGPILGTLLTNVAVEGAWPLTAGAAGFGLALGLPFALFAMFPNWLQSLPKSGGWMTDVKVVLGFIELALAIKFFSNADLVKQWGLLKREVFIGLWALIGLLIVLYLLGIIRISHSSPVKKFSFTRIAFITVFGAMTLYLLPGLTNTSWANLRLISGFPPPRTTYSLYSHGSVTSVFEPLQNDYQQALKLAKEQNKPVLIDFTGWACVNCRRMEENVWPNYVVDSLMRKEFIVVSLYVDERKRLPLPEQITYTTSAGTRKSLVTVGDKWSAFQVENFGATAQPQYAIISPEKVALTRTKFYTSDADEFAQWLQCGLDAYRKSRTK